MGANPPLAGIMGSSRHVGASGWLENEEIKEILTEHIDEKDYEIYRVLNENGRISDTELGERVGLSRTAVARRREILQEEGVIDIVGVLILQEANLAYADIRVSFKPTASREAIEQLIEDMLYEEEIYEIDEYVGGDYDLLVRAWSGSLQRIKEYIHTQLQDSAVVEDYELQPVTRTRKAWHKVINNDH